jgi:hypothetical protein
MSHIRDANMTPEEEQKYVAFLRQVEQIQKNNFCLDSVKPAFSTPAYISGKLKELQMYNPIDLVIVDHMGLMSTTAKDFDSNWEKLGIIALELKSVAMEHQVPIIVLSHVGRKGMESREDTFELEHVGLSLEPLKHVDTIMSWRIVDPEAFKLTHIGQGKLSIQGARDAEEAAVTLNVNTNLMKICEYVITVAH